MRDALHNRLLYGRIKMLPPRAQKGWFMSDFFVGVATGLGVVLVVSKAVLFFVRKKAKRQRDRKVAELSQQGVPLVAIVSGGAYWYSDGKWFFYPLEDYDEDSPYVDFDMDLGQEIVIEKLSDDAMEFLFKVSDALQEGQQ